MANTKLINAKIIYADLMLTTLEGFTLPSYLIQFNASDGCTYNFGCKIITEHETSIIYKTMQVVGVTSLNELTGKYVRIQVDTRTDKVTDIYHILTDKNVNVEKIRSGY